MPWAWHLAHVGVSPLHLAFREWQLMQASLTRRRGRVTVVAPSPSPWGDVSANEQVNPRRSQLAHDVPSPSRHFTFRKRHGWQVLN